MQTIKTAVVVVLLLFVLYGGYVALNGTDTPLAEELENLVSLDETTADVAGAGAFQPAKPAGEEPASASAFERFASRPLPSFSPGNNAAIPAAPTFPSSIPSVPSMNIPDLELPSSGPASVNPASVNPTSVPLVPPAFGNPGPAIDPNSADLSSSLPEPKINATNVSAKSEPGFGLALPGGKAPETGLLPKLPPSPTAAVPALDLPSLHGDAKNLAETTAERSANSEPSALNSEPSASNAVPVSKPGRSYENAKQLAMDQIEGGRLKEALATLSVFYNAQELTNSQRTDLVDLLDALAREVIYSRRHLMDFPYVIAPNETLEQVCKRYNVPTDVMIRINGLDPTIDPPAGTKLKIVPGPFRAEVDLTRNEFTMFVGDLYAGRYPASFGQEPQPKTGVYHVVDKKRDRNYYGNNGVQISADDPSNPYGGFWLDLGNEVCIHGSPATEGGPGQLGCISLSPLDAGDVFGMLGRDSQVTIRR